MDSTREAAEASQPAPADTEHSGSLPRTPSHAAAPTAIPSSPNLAQSDPLVVVPTLHLTASTSPPDRGASAIPTPRGGARAVPISPVSAHGGAASSRSGGSNGSAVKRRRSLPHGTPSPPAPPWVPAISSNSAHRIVLSSTYDPALPSHARMRDASKHLPPAERRVFQPAEGYPPSPVRVFQEDSGLPLEPVAAERFSPRQILAVAGGRRSPGNSEPLDAPPPHGAAAAAMSKSNPLPTSKRRPLTHRSPESIRRLSEASTRASVSPAPKGGALRRQSSDSRGRGGTHSGPLSGLEHEPCSTPPSARAAGRARAQARVNASTADRLGARRPAAPPKQAFGRTLEDRGPKRVQSQSVPSQVGARPSGAARRGGRVTSGARPLGSRGRAPARPSRRSAAASLASASSFPLSRVDEIGEEDPGDADPGDAEGGPLGGEERIGETASLGDTNPLGPAEAEEFLSADSRSLAQTGASLPPPLQTDTSMASATSASLGTSSLNPPAGRSGALDAAPSAADSGAVAPAAGPHESSAPLPAVAESSAASEDGADAPLAPNGALPDDTMGTDTGSRDLGAATVLPDAPAVAAGEQAESLHLSEGSSQSVRHRLHGNLPAITQARLALGVRGGHSGGGGSVAESPTLESPVAADGSRAHSAALSSAMRDGPTVTVSLGVAPGAPVISEAPPQRLGIVEPSEPYIGATTAQADVPPGTPPSHAPPAQELVADSRARPQGTNKEASNGAVAAVRAASGRGEDADKVGQGRGVFACFSCLSR